MKNRSYQFARCLGLTALGVALLGPLPAAAEPFLGEIRCFAFNFAPKGWALTQGQLLPINQNTALFSLLGTTYGGNGVNTFALPNLQHRIMIGASASRPLGDSSGSVAKSISTANLPAHTHNFAALGSTALADSNNPAGRTPAVKPRVPLYVTPSGLTNNVAMEGGTTSADGGSATPAPIANLQPYLTFNCAIALQGIFPSQN